MRQVLSRFYADSVHKRREIAVKYVSPEGPNFSGKS